jgi:drug/metabolite transporter (DMT)-like permease
MTSRPVRSTPAAASGRSLGSGVWFGLASAAAFGTSGTFAKGLLGAGWSPAAAVTVRIIGAALVLLVPAVVMLRGRWHLLRRNALLVVTFGLFAMAACQLFYFNAVQTLSVGVALLLEYLGIVLVVVWLWLRHGNRPRRWTLVGIVASIGGLLLVLDVTGGMQVDVVGVLWGLAAAVGLATYFVLCAKDETGLPPLVLAAAGMVVGATGLVVAGVVGVVPMRWTTGDVLLAGLFVPWWVTVVGLCVLSTAFAYATGVTATRRLGSKVASFLGLTEVLASIIVAWLLLGEMPLPVQLVGGVLIIAGVVAVRYDELTHGAPDAGRVGAVDAEAGVPTSEPVPTAAA